MAAEQTPRCPWPLCFPALTSEESRLLQGHRPWLRYSGPLFARGSSRCQAYELLIPDVWVWRAVWLRPLAGTAGKEVTIRGQATLPCTSASVARLWGTWTLSPARVPSLLPSLPPSLLPDDPVTSGAESAPRGRAPTFSGAGALDPWCGGDSGTDGD